MARSTPGRIVMVSESGTVVALTIRRDKPMTDFIVYISAQQRMQIIMHDSEPTDRRRRDRRHVATWSSLHAIRRHISVALYRLAEAVQPVGEPATIIASAPH